MQEEVRTDKVFSEGTGGRSPTENELDLKKSHQPLRLFIIDDDFATRQVLREYFSQQGCIVEVFSDATLALTKLKQQHRSTACDLVLTDVVMPKFDGLQLTQALKENRIDVPIIMMTGYNSEEMAMQAIAAGANDYIKKPIQALELEVICKRAIRLHRLEQEYRQLKARLAASSQNEGIIGNSPKMRHLMQLIDQLAPSQSTVLIHGETGSGKELVARAIHNRSNRRGKPFVAINCSAFPDTLLEAELFGYVRGAFTDAAMDRKGLFLEAEGGTLFLDEIGDMSPALQVKLLRVVQERLVKALGSNDSHKIDVRLIAATHQDLALLVDQNRFRQDLYYRLCVIRLDVPPLRDRRDDIPMLAEYFREKYVAANPHGPKKFTRAAIAKLFDADWPGNVRELENTIERAVVFAKGPYLDESDLEIHSDKNTAQVDLNELFQNYPTLEELEQRYIEFMLMRTNNHKDETARILGIHRKTLYRKERSAHPTAPARIEAPTPKNA